MREREPPPGQSTIKISVKRALLASSLLFEALIMPSLLFEALIMHDAFDKPCTYHIHLGGPSPSTLGSSPKMSVTPCHPMSSPPTKG